MPARKLNDPLRRPESQQRNGNQNRVGKTNAERIKKMGLFKEPRRPGPKISAELIAKVGECFLDGLTNEETALWCDVSERTIAAWRNLQPIKKHEVGRKRTQIQRIRDGKERDWTRIAWWLERRYPLEFSRPEVAHAIGQNVNHTNIQNNLVISAEVAEKLTQRTQDVRLTIQKLFDSHGDRKQLVDTTLNKVDSMFNVPNDGPSKVD